MGQLLKRTDVSCKTFQWKWMFEVWFSFKQFVLISCYLCISIFCPLWLVHRFGGEEQQEDNREHLGNAIMSFYSALIDLLGRCAPEMHVSKIPWIINLWSLWKKCNLFFFFFKKSLMLHKAAFIRIILKYLYCEIILKCKICIFLYTFKHLIYYCDGKAEFLQQPLLQSSNQNKIKSLYCYTSCTQGFGGGGGEEEGHIFTDFKWTSILILLFTHSWSKKEKAKLWESEPSWGLSYPLKT